MKDTYRTILRPPDVILHKDRNSKFFGYAFPIASEDDVKKHIVSLKKQHPSAGHWCYAYQIGTETIQYRVNDDGEPSNSAGTPIYGQIQSFDLTNILIVVVRYFGGTKLGVGGLIKAYRTTAQMTLEASKIVERTMNKILIVSCNYENLNKVMRIVKEKNLTILDQDLQLDCKIKIEVRLKNAETLLNQFDNLQDVKAKFL